MILQVIKKRTQSLVKLQKDYWTKWKNCLTDWPIKKIRSVQFISLDALMQSIKATNREPKSCLHSQWHLDLCMCQIPCVFVPQCFVVVLACSQHFPWELVISMRTLPRGCFPFPVPPSLSSVFITRVWWLPVFLPFCARAHGWVYRICQTLEWSPSRSWLSIVY